MGTSTKLQKTKFTALVTYVIVWVCMVAALFIPKFDNGTMLIKELPDALRIVTGLDFSLPGFFTAFGLTSYYTTFNTKLNLAAIAVVAYGVVIILGLIALIVVLAGKKNSKGVRVIAYIIEVLGMLSLLAFAYDRLTLIGMGELDTLKADGQTGWVLLAVLAVIWLMFTIQAIYYKKGAGFAKSLLFILSLGALCTLFLNSGVFTASWLDSITDALKASTAFIGSGSDATSGFELINKLGDTLGNGITYIVALITAILVIVNLVFDALAISTGTNKGSKTINLVRYGLELVLAIVTAIMGAINNVTPGIYLYALMIIVFLQIVVSTIRMFTHSAAAEDDDDEDDEEEDEDEDEDDEEEVYEESDADSALRNGFYEAPASTSTQPPVYTRAYTYQDDGFLNSLTPGERAEFYAVFIDKRHGNYYFLPEYIIGGDNKEFFQALFIYLGKFMGTLSDGLMNKIYRRLNILD